MSTAPVEAYAEIDGGRLFYRRQGRGQPLLLVHGFALDHRVWALQWPALAADFDVISVDLRGFGRSSLPGAAPYAHHADLRALLDALGVERAHLMGHSLGGGIAASFAVAYPQRAGRLVLSAPLLRGHALSALLTLLKRVWQIAARDGVDAARTAWLHSDLFAPALDTPTGRALLTAILADYSGWHWQHRDPETGVEPPLAERLPELLAPTLVLVGARDLPDFVHMGEALAGQAPDARLELLPTLGHGPSVESPDLFNRLALDFLNGGV
ncbi:alpha/beta fold hydrolase [Immundisolibacter sp.]|uniref:alpha/beta fold hydrolase n=1 Tax=Immundisolibacter sp. TaxID=1934948 RepID=UPI002626C4EE|nr:alpha/beta fold hydrolase [Immundisolibacter sp.]MDD3652378.1 alpha/beta fold hydrolase [Immundisolibacter sp.]